MPHNESSKIMPALVMGALIFVVAFAMLLVIGDYRFVAAVFLAGLLALLTTIVLYLGFGMGDSRPYGAAQGHEKPASAKASAPASTATGAAVSTAPEVADTSAADAEAARKAAEAEAAKNAEAAAAAERTEAARAEQARLAAAQADSEAARAREAEAARAREAEAARAREAEAARARDAEAEAAREAAETPAVAAPSAAGQGEDYDGDGVHEGTNEGTRPAGLDSPRDGKADDLKMIKGVGPKMEKLCNSLGFWHFDQVASWNADEVAWVDANLQGFKGRVSRDEWVEQARLLAAGGETEFSKRVEGGDVY